MKPIEKLIEQEVRRLAKEAPNNIYTMDNASQSCSYTKGICSDGSIGCIFGQAIKAIGLANTPALLYGKDTTSIRELLQEIIGRPSFYFVMWCEKVQNAQDSLHPWARAIKIADLDVPHLLENRRE